MHSQPVNAGLSLNDIRESYLTEQKSAAGHRVSLTAYQHSLSALRLKWLFFLFETSACSGNINRSLTYVPINGTSTNPTRRPVSLARAT